MNSATILVGDVRNRLAEISTGSVQCCVTSPPYWGLRDYGNDGQIGLELSVESYVAEMVEVFRDVRRVLKDDGVLWLNLGDSYAGSGKGPAGKSGKNPYHDIRNLSQQRGPIVPDGLKPKDLIGVPWRVAFALQADDWWLRQDIIWAKPNPMPESVTDRCTKSHEYVFLLTKSAKYYFNNEAIKEPSLNIGVSKIRFGGNKYGDSGDPSHATKSGNEDTDTGTRNRRSVWTIPTKPFRGAHFAVMPEALVEPCVLASTKPNDLILDPFTGSGTVAVVAMRHGRNFIGTEINVEYAEIARDRIQLDQPMFNDVILDMKGGTDEQS